jgi:polyisoprenoid-binding protein YceI
MTKCLFRSLIFLSWFFSVCAAMAEGSGQNTYVFDSDHSYILYHVNHFDFSDSSGKWLFNGTLLLDEAKPEYSKVSITIPIGKIDSGVALLDDHLRGKLFFDAAQFPTATFESTKILVTGKDTAKVIGILTLHGISHAVTLDVKLNKLGINFATEKESVGFTATTQIKRSDFDILTLLPEVGDDVKIEIQAEASQTFPAKTDVKTQ